MRLDRMPASRAGKSWPAVGDGRVLRLDAVYLTLGDSTYGANRGRKNPCGSGGQRQLSLCEVERTLDIVPPPGSSTA